jgi:hypothetical protein
VHPHDLAVAGKGVAAVEMGGRSIALDRRFVPGAPRMDGLVRRRRQRPEQLDQMRAPLNAAEPGLYGAPPAGAISPRKRLANAYDLVSIR